MSVIVKYLIILAVAGGIVGSYVYMVKKIASLNQQVSEKVNNVKSYQQQLLTYKDANGNLHNQVIQMQQSKAELKASKDIADKALIDSLSKYHIKVANVSQAGQIQTVTQYIPGPVRFVHPDTTVDLSKPPYVTEVVTIKDDSLRSEVSMTNTQTLAWVGKRETINPPSPLFFIHWFQKKQTITEVDIVNSNPYIHTINQHFTLVTK